MRGKDYTITLNFEHRIRFTKGAFSKNNTVLSELLETNGKAKVLVFIEKEVAKAFVNLESDVLSYLGNLEGFQQITTRILVGGEECKRDEQVLRAAWQAVEEDKIDRHSYIFAIGGGAFLDVIGFASTTAHRGCRFVRFPTTTLSQDDSGSGVKNGINAFGKKNWIGAFSVPYAVINDFEFLYTQSEHVCRSGLVEAVKVALVRDKDFFLWIEENTDNLRNLKPDVLEKAVERSAIQHSDHIAQGGDPFELGSSRPLDYGHWAAHKLEQISDFTLSHADAVAVGLALDTLYSWKAGFLTESDAMRVVSLLQQLDMPIYNEGFAKLNEKGIRYVFAGIEEFREHLGGELTVMMLDDLGKGKDVHQLDTQLLEECIELLKQLSCNSINC